MSNNDEYFFVYSQGCMAGGFHDPLGYDCIAEYLTVKSKNGAFACVMNACFGFGKYNSTDGPSQRFDRQFWDALYEEGKNTLGKANQDSKEDNAPDIKGPCIMFCYYELNLFGDPAVPIYGAKKKSYSDSKSSSDLDLVKSNLKINSFLLLKMFENLIRFLFRK